LIAKIILASTGLKMEIENSDRWHTNYYAAHGNVMEFVPRIFFCWKNDVFESLETFSDSGKGIILASRFSFFPDEQASISAGNLPLVIRKLFDKL